MAMGAPSRQDKGREKPCGPPELHRHGTGLPAAQGSARWPRRGGQGKGVLSSFVPRLRKTNWSATEHLLPFGEFGVCPWLPMGFGGVLVAGRQGAAAIRAGRLRDAQLWGPRMVRHGDGATTWDPWARHGGEEGAVGAILPGQTHQRCAWSGRRESGSGGAALTYGYQMVDVKKKKKEKKPIRKFPSAVHGHDHRPSPLSPLIVPIHPSDSAHPLCNQVFPGAASLNKTLQ